MNPAAPTPTPPAPEAKREHPLLAALRTEHRVRADALESAAKVLEGEGATLAELRRHLIQQRAIPADMLQQAIAKLFALEFRNHLDDVEVLPEFAQALPIRFAKKHMIFPIRLTDQEVWLAVENPDQLDAVQDVSRKFGKRAHMVVSTHQSILSLINRAYDRAQSAAGDQVIDEIDGVDAGSVGYAWGIEEPEDLIDAHDEEPIKRLLNNILYQAARNNASDVHVDSSPTEVVIRFRVDGVMHTASNLPKSVQRTLINRIKIMSRLDISQHGLPQDGRTLILIAGRKIDIRVSIMPTIQGEKAVMRLLFQDQDMFDLRSLGMPEEIYTVWSKLIQQTGGIILVSGPTGSGKTTTLYAALSEIDHHANNIMTIEDPVEYKIAGYVQTEVNAKLGLTFANALRSVLRQDPDVIMVGEMRDRETALIAIQAALTGHTVFSTVHTNSAPATVTRLVDMGIEPYLVSSTVMAVLAQRLVRKICEGCKTEIPAEPALLHELGVPDKEHRQWKHLYKGAGCAQCKNTGYSGRRGIHELLVIDDPIKKVLLQSNEANVIRQAAVANGMLSMRHHGIQLVKAGITTPDEVISATREE